MIKMMKFVTATFLVTTLPLGLIFWAGPAQALTFAEAAARGSAKFSELSGMKGFIAKMTSSALRNVTMTNITASGNGLTGDVSLRGKPWTIIVNSDPGAKTSFVGFGPKTGFTFGDLIGNNPTSKLFDKLKLTRPTLLIAIGDVKLGSDKLPANIKSFLAPHYENPNDFTLDISQGLNLVSALDMSKAGIIDKAIKFFGGQSSKIRLQGEMDMAVIDSMIKVLGAPPGPNLKLSAAIPTFKPTIAGVITFPGKVQFTLRAHFFKNAKWLGFDGKTKFKIGKELIDAKLAQTVHLPSKPGQVTYTKTKLSIFEDRPYRRAFGVKWLTIKNYFMLIKAKSDGGAYVEMGGDTLFGKKQLSLETGVGVDAKKAGFPIPSYLNFTINDGPGKVGVLALKDILSIYNAMAKATGNPLKVPLDKVPDVAIAGLKKGEGPKIKLLFEGAGDDGFDIKGRLRVLGSDVAVVDKAFAKANSGVEIRAKVNQFKAGPITLPNGAAEIVVLLDRSDGKVPEPHVLIESKGLSLFGSKQELDLSLYLAKSHFIAKQHFGSLFKFDFSAQAVAPNLSSMAGLGNAEFKVAASLSSDPVDWIKTAGKKEVEKYFDTLTAGEAAALATLDSAQKAVNKLNRDIKSMKDKVIRERKPAIDALKSAEAEVSRLQGEINHFERRRVHFQRQIKSCNQTYRGCVVWSARRTGCHKSVFGNCVIPKMGSYCAQSANIPDYAARGWCEAKNTKPRSEMAWADGKKHAVIAAKVAAVQTVAGIRKSINKLPVELDPRVAGLIAGKEVATLGLKAAKEAVKGIAQLAALLADGIKALDAPDIFALEKSAIQGDLAQALKGAPVIIDLNYRVRGKPYRNRFSFTMGNQADNARRFGVMALGIAVKEVVKAGKKLKVIPHALLDQVENLYLQEMAKINTELSKVTANNQTANIKINANPDGNTPTLVASVTNDHTARRTQAEAVRKHLIKLQADAGDKLSKGRIAQLSSLLQGNKWKRIRGKAIDIAAGANGSVWHIDVNKLIYKWNGSSWTKVPGSGKRIDVGPNGHAWIVGIDDGIYRWNGKGGWDKKPIPIAASDIGVGADGSVWAVFNKSKGVYRLNGSKWIRVKGGMTQPRWPASPDGRKFKRLAHNQAWKSGFKRIDVDDKGRAWIVFGNTYIARWNPSNGKWNGIAGSAIDIGVGADGTPVAISHDSKTREFDFSPFVWDGKKWNRIAGGMSQITVDRNGDPWGVDAAGNIWAWSDAAKAPAAKIKIISKFPANSIITIQVKSSGRCFDQAGRDKKGTQAHAWDCNAAQPNQRFKVVDKNGEWFSLVNQRNKMCVGVAGASKNNYAQVVQWPCVYGGDHLWRKVDRGGGWFSLVNKVSGRCLNLAGAKKPNGSKFDQYECGATNPTQLFRLTTASKPMTAGAWTSFQVRHSNKCLDVAKASKAKGMGLHQWDCHKGLNQQWRRLDKGSGWFQLQVRHSNMCLDVSGASKANGAKVQQYDCHKGQNQQWRQVDRGGGWVALQARHSNKCLDVAGVRKTNGAKFHQYDCHKGQNQQFRGK